MADNSNTNAIARKLRYAYAALKTNLRQKSEKSLLYFLHSTFRNLVDFVQEFLKKVLFSEIKIFEHFVFH